MVTKRQKRRAGGVLVGAGATALTGTLLLADPLGATEPSTEKAPVVAGTALADQAKRTVAAGDAGTVTFQRTGDVLRVVGATPTEGWTPMVKRPIGETVKVGFVSVDGAKVHVRGHLTDEGTFRFSVREKGTFDRAAFEQAKAAFFQALADKAAAEKAAAAQAAAEQAAAVQAEQARQAKAAAAQAEADDDRKDHDGWCDKDGEEFGGAGFEGDDDWDHDGDWKDHHDGRRGWDGDGDHDGWGRHR